MALLIRLAWGLFSGIAMFILLFLAKKFVDKDFPAFEISLGFLFGVFFSILIFS